MLSTLRSSTRSGNGACQPTRTSNSRSRKGATNACSSSAEKVRSIHSNSPDSGMLSSCRVSPTAIPSGVEARGIRCAVTEAAEGLRLLAIASVLRLPPRTTTRPPAAGSTTRSSLERSDIPVGCVAVQPCLRVPLPAPAPYLNSSNTQYSLRPPRGESCSRRRVPAVLWHR